jgi:predicted PurR-regulated permease PerM
VFGAQVQSEFTGLSKTLPAAWRGFQERLDGLPIGEGLAASWQDWSPSGTNIMSRLGDLAMTLGSAAADFVLVVFGAIFLAANPKLYRRGLIKLVPRRGRDLANEALTDSGRALKLWLIGQLVAMLLVGLLTWLGLWFIGLPAALALALTAGFLEIIPYVGPVLAAIPGVLLALLISPDMALWTLFVYLGVQQLEGVLITPLIQGKAVTLPPAVTVFGVVAAGIMFGFVGLIFAAPLLVVAYVLVKKLYVREALDTDTPLPGEPEKA